MLSPCRGSSSISDSTRESCEHDDNGTRESCEHDGGGTRESCEHDDGDNAASEKRMRIEQVQEKENLGELEKEREEEKAPQCTVVKQRFTVDGYAEDISKGAIGHWVKYLFMFDAFVKAHGHGGVPLKLDRPKYPKLGAWVASQRQAMRNLTRIKQGEMPTSCHSLTRVQHQLLIRVGFCFKGRASQVEFFTQLRRLQHFRSRFPTVAIPDDYDTTQYPKLGAWIKKQRTNFRTMSQRRRSLLLAVGIDE